MSVVYLLPDITEKKCKGCDIIHPFTKEFWYKSGKYFGCKVLKKQYQSSQEYRDQERERHRKRCLAPGYKEKFNESVKKSHQNPKNKARKKATAQKHKTKPGYKEKQRAYAEKGHKTVMAKIAHDDDYKKKYHEKNKKGWRTKKQRMLHDEKYAKEYYEKSRAAGAKIRSLPEYQEYARKYAANRAAIDPAFKIKGNIRTRLRFFAKQCKKRRVHFSEIGCTAEFLKLHIESLWTEGMTWDNYGPRGWHLDHIFPLAKIDGEDDTQLVLAARYDNIRPMWESDNLQKSAKIIIPLVENTEIYKYLISEGYVYNPETDRMVKK